MLFYNQSANWHLHQLPNGVLVEHAHPYSKTTSHETPYQNHTHSDFEMLIFGLLSSTIGLVVLLLISLVLFFNDLLEVNHFDSLFIPKNYLPLYNPLRGPPLS